MARKGKHLLQRIYGGGALPFSSQGQVDAAAELDEGEGHSGDDGGASVADGEIGRRCEWRRRGDLVRSIYKEKPAEWAQKTRRPKNKKKHSYAATKALRFSDGH